MQILRYAWTVILLVPGCGNPAPAPPEPAPDPGHRLHTTLGGIAEDPFPAASGLFFASAPSDARFYICLKPAGSSTVSRVTEDDSEQREPALSPDGRRLAFSSDAQGTWDVYVSAPTGGARATWIAVAATDEWEIHPAWSRDGSRLAWCALSRDDHMWKVRVREADGAIRELGNGFAPEWSPVEDLLVCQRASGSAWTLAVLDPATGAARELLPRGGAAAITPSWSPDGRWVLYAETTESHETTRPPANGDLWAVALDGSSRVHLTKGAAAEWNPRSGPDGRIYYCRAENGAVEIWSFVSPLR
ncbi:MAG: PD40 domain-containing protein [Planctomycetes bacterium]|nr:PD40 domain-containing protein [Planctomycetota bacterium]